MHALKHLKQFVSIHSQFCNSFVNRNIVLLYKSDFSFVYALLFIMIYHCECYLFVLSSQCCNHFSTCLARFPLVVHETVPSVFSEVRRLERTKNLFLLALPVCWD